MQTKKFYNIVPRLLITKILNLLSPSVQILITEPVKKMKTKPFSVRIHTTAVKMKSQKNNTKSQLKFSGLYYKNFTIIICHCDDGIIVIYDCNGSGQNYSKAILIAFAEANVIKLFVHNLHIFILS